MSSTPGSGNTPPTPALLAKAALRRLAEQRLEPTPENYQRAYEAESGQPSSPPPTAPAPLDGPEGGLTPAEDGKRWSGLIDRIVRGAERGSRQWTTGRKKDSLKRVLEGSKSSADRLHQRLPGGGDGLMVEQVDDLLQDGEHAPGPGNRLDDHGLTDRLAHLLGHHGVPQVRARQLSQDPRGHRPHQRLPAGAEAMGARKEGPSSMRTSSQHGS